MSKAPERTLRGALPLGTVHFYISLSSAKSNHDLVKCLPTGHPYAHACTLSMNSQVNITVFSFSLVGRLYTVQMEQNSKKFSQGHKSEGE